jgi:hypothetical protein
MGAGFKYNVVKVDVSYLFSASKVKTLRKHITFLLLLILETNMMYMLDINQINNPNFNSMKFGFFPKTMKNYYYQPILGITHFKNYLLTSKIDGTGAVAVEKSSLYLFKIPVGAALLLTMDKLF